MIDNKEERTVVSPAGPPPDADATLALQPGMALAGADRTQMAISTECPVCHTTNPPGETYCGDCGFLLGSTPGAVMEEAPAPEARLVAPDGREFGLNPGRNTVGRMNADVPLGDPTVSRQHAVIGLEESRCWVEDLGSTNGTLVNGQRLSPNQPRDLANGSEVTFGSVALRAVLPERFVAVPVLPGGVSEGAAPMELPASSPARLISEDRGTEYPVPVGTVSVGRRSANNFAFPTDAYISGRHAEITFDGETLSLMDVGSTNGTTVNGDRIAPNTLVPLHDGDMVVMGQQRLRVRIETAPEPPAEPPAETDEQPAWEGDEAEE